jgi:hypothetical protein
MMPYYESFCALLVFNWDVVAIERHKILYDSFGQTRGSHQTPFF